MRKRHFERGLLLVGMLLATWFPVLAQNGRKLTGTVVDAASGDPLIGAYVSLVGGKNVGALTDVDGSFTLVLPDGTSNTERLKVESVGFEETEVTVGEVVSSGVIRVAVKSELLEEVLVVGYGTQKKVSSVGSIAQTKGEELLKVGNMNSVSEAIQGQMAGVVVVNTTGQPGENTSNITIRGKSTWQNTNPLILVDGIEREMDDVDFNEIESVSVLKDASATAVYGVRGGNGVILLTTKRGTSERPTVKFSASVGFKQPTSRNNWADNVTSMQAWNEAYANDGNYDTNVLFPQSTIDAWRNAIATGNTGPYNDTFPSVIWEDELLQTAISENYNVNVNGKTAFMKYFASIGYQHDGSIYKAPKQETFDPRMYFNRLNWRANFDFNLTPTTVFSVNIAGKMGYKNKPYHSDVFGLLTRSPEHDFPIRWSDGVYGDGFARGSNPLANFYEGGQIRDKTFQGWYDAKVNQKLDFVTKGLSAYASVSYDQATTIRNTVQLGAAFSATSSDATQQNSYPSEFRTYDYKHPQYDEQGRLYYDYTYDFHGLQTYTVPAATSFDTVTRIYNKLYYEIGLNYARTFGGHEVTALALFNRQKTVSSGSTTLSFPSYREDWVGRVTYNWKERYLFEANISYTGSEKFAPGMRFGLFPSWSIGWRVTEEPWMKWSEKVLTNMKIRFSQGVVGTDAGAERFQYIQLFTQDAGHGWGRYDDTMTGPMYLEGAVANANATWETSTKYNLGVELGFFKKLSVALDLFDEQRRDILLAPRTTAAWTGAAYTAANLGRAKNHGLELEVGWQDKIGSDFHYHINFGFATSESRIIDKDDPPLYDDHLKDAGKPIGWATRYIVSGNFNSVDDFFNAAQSNIANTTNIIQMGDFSYIDYNADGLIDSKDKVVSPYLTYPVTTYSLKIGFDWKGLSVSALFYSPQGLHRNSASYYLYDFPYNYVKAQPNTTDRWSPDKAVDSGFIRPTIHSVNKWNNQSSTYEYIDASYIRLKNVEISYQIPKKWQKAVHMSNASVFATGNNLLTWWKGDSRLDPETTTSSGGTSDTGNIYPIVKTYTIGVRFGF